MTKPQVHPEKKQQPPKKGDHDGGDASYGSKTKLMDKKSSSFGAVTAVPSAKIAMNNFLLLMFRLQYLHGQDKTQLVPTDDPFRLFELSFNCFELAHDYAVDWKSEMKSNLVNDEIAKKNASEYIKAKPLDVVRLRPMHLPVELHSSNIFEFELLKSPYGYELTDNGEDWYVKFADQGAFGCSETDLFASDEIIALQHPILGSVKDALKDISQNGLFVQTTWQWFTGAQGLERKDCVYFDDPKLYIPKDKSKDTLRYKEVSPKVVDLAGRPTPIIFYNVPRLCLITDFEKFGEKFGKAFLPELKSAIVKSEDLVYSNLIAMAGIDQLANPLRPRQGKYKVYELRHIFRTAFTAFSGAVRKTRGDDKFLTSKPEKPKNVTIHTGDWGCEEFGGNRTVMAYLQIAAARAAGVTRLCYHTMKPEEEIWEALDLLNRKWPRSGSVKVEEGLLKAIEGLEKEWKKMEFRK